MASPASSTPFIVQPAPQSRPNTPTPQPRSACVHTDLTSIPYGTRYACLCTGSTPALRARRSSKSLRRITTQVDGTTRQTKSMVEERQIVSNSRPRLAPEEVVYCYCIGEGRHNDEEFAVLRDSDSACGLDGTGDSQTSASRAREAPHLKDGNSQSHSGYVGLRLSGKSDLARPKRQRSARERADIDRIGLEPIQRALDQGRMCPRLREKLERWFNWVSHGDVWKEKGGD